MNRDSAKFPDLISKGQIQVIKIRQKEIGMEDDLYRDWLMSHFGVSSCTQLTKAQATKAIELLASYGTAIRTRGDGKGTSAGQGNRRKHRDRQGVGREGSKVIRLASSQEMGKIDALAALIDWEYRDGLKRWMEKRLKIDRVRTSREAWLVIEGLKKMFSIRMEKLCGKDWWTKKFDDPKVMRFIREHCPEGYR